MENKLKQLSAEALIAFQIFDNAYKALLIDMRKAKIDAIEDVYFNVPPDSQLTALCFIRTCKFHGIDTYIELEGLSFDQRIHLSATFYDYKRVADAEKKLKNG